MTDGEREHPSPRERLTWPADAPDVIISALMHISTRTEPHQPKKPYCHWQIRGITVMANADQYEPALLGELSIASELWRVDVSGIATLRTRGAARAEWLAGQDVGEFASRYAPWVSHALWDFLATQARAASAPTWSGLEIPRVTPKLKVLTSEPASARAARRERRPRPSKAR